jgi:hypothetical protein
MKTSQALQLSASVVGIAAVAYWLLKKPSESEKIAKQQTAQQKEQQSPSGSEIISVTFKPSDITAVQQVDPVIERVGRGWNLGALVAKGLEFEYQIFWLDYDAQKSKPSDNDWRMKIVQTLGVSPNIITLSKR